MKICIVQPTLNKFSETFLKAHAELLPFQNTVIHFKEGKPYIDERPLCSQSLFIRGMHKLISELKDDGNNYELIYSLAKIFKKKFHVILAEYGPIGVITYKAAMLADKPLIVHFHGYDVSKQDVVNHNREKYLSLFNNCSAIIAVSKRMVQDLEKLGADTRKIHLNPCGVDTDLFQGSNPEASEPNFLAVGRFVEKKAPYLSILAFARVHSRFPGTKLYMIGDGPLLGICKDLVKYYNIENRVYFLGACNSNVVKEKMITSRAFIQHSIQASDGDCEGTPVSVMEAQSCGLPVIATRHAGIEDVVIHNETGFLIEEKDVNSMSRYMCSLAGDPSYAATLGRAGRERIINYYTMRLSINNLASIIKLAR